MESPSIPHPVLIQSRRTTLPRGMVRLAYSRFSGARPCGLAAHHTRYQNGHVGDVDVAVVIHVGISLIDAAEILTHYSIDQNSHIGDVDHSVVVHVTQHAYPERFPS